MARPELRFPEFTDEWFEIKLSEVATFLGGGTPSTKKENFWRGTIPWISSSDIFLNDIFNINKTRFITQEAIDQSATKLIPSNSILLVSRVGVGKVAIADVDLCTSQDFTNLVNIKEDVVYIAYALFNKMQKELISTQGTSIKGITSKDIKEFKIMIPCLGEQKKIADFLSSIDDIIRIQEEKILALEEQKKGVMKKIFNREVRFKADDGSEYPEWEEKKLEEVVVFLDGRRRPLEKGERLSGIYPYYGASGIIDYVDDYLFEGEHILLSEDGANIVDRNYRVCFLANGKYWVNNHAHVLKAKDSNNNYFICEQLESLDYIKYNTGTAQPKLNQDVCKKIRLKMPCFQEQQKIASCLFACDEIIQIKREKLEIWKKMKKGLLQQMFV